MVDYADLGRTILAYTLAGLFAGVWLLHSHILLMAGCGLEFGWFRMCCGNNHVQSATAHIIGLVIGSWTTPGIVVYIMHNYTEWYSEIQSWEIAYILWGFAAGLIVLSLVSWVELYHDGKRTKRTEFWKQLMRPFGFDFSAGNLAVVLVPLVSFAPAIVGGYIANFVFEETFTLECDDKYNQISTMCQDGVCCITLSNHENWIHFIPELAGSALTAWGVVTLIGSFVIAQFKKGSKDDDDDDDDEDDEDDEENQDPLISKSEDESQAINVSDVDGAQ